MSKVLHLLASALGKIVVEITFRLARRALNRERKQILKLDSHFRDAYQRLDNKDKRLSKNVQKARERFAGKISDQRISDYLGLEDEG